MDDSTGGASVNLTAERGPPLGVRLLIGLVAGWLGFEAITLGTRRIVDGLGGLPFGTRHLILKAIVVAVSFAVWVLAVRRPVCEMGWRRPERVGVWRLALLYVLSAVSMGGASLAMILTDSHHPLMSQLSLPEIVLGVWIVSSIAEEVFVRGLVQPWMAGPGANGRGAQGSGGVVLVSAVLFASLHVPLMWSGAGVLGGAILIAATFGVGLACAQARASTASLWHPIGIHIFGNVAALPFGVLGAILYRLVNGEFPVH